jgi:hypothetical protein
MRTTQQQLAIAAALHAAAAAAASQPHGLHISSCKLIGAGPDSTAILQALPGSTLTSLDYNTTEPGEGQGTLALAKKVEEAMAATQQLRQLCISSCGTWVEVVFNAALQHIIGLTNLTSLTMPTLRIRVDFICISSESDCPTSS